ncbi:MAG: regulatory protein RecX [Coxiellaceae bacterium]|nr:regulatory protein RecX [Coxiellaceae bacterium]
MNKTHEKAIDYLSRREHSRAELKQKLAVKDFPLEDIETTLDDLAARNFQSDARFAETYVRYRKQAGFGPLKIIAELRERGVDDAIISSTVDSNANEWQTQMIDVWKRKFSSGIKTKDKAAQFRFLASRGYLTEAINKILFSTKS